MRFTTSDIHILDRFASALHRACVSMQAGTPISRALRQEQVSRTTFYSLLKGLRQSAADSKEEQRGEEQTTEDDKKKALFRDLDTSHLHPAWQDDLASDICGDDDYIIRDDFEQTLSEIEEQCLTAEERAVIDCLYHKRMTIAETAIDQGAALSTIEDRKARALRKLRRHKDDLILGREYIRRLNHMEELYRKYDLELKWMQDTTEFLESLESRMTKKQPETPDRRTGAAGSTGTIITADTSLDTLGFDDREMRAFNREGLLTAGDIFALSEDEIMELPPSAIRGALRLYRITRGDENGGERL